MRVKSAAPLTKYIIPDTVKPGKVNIQMWDEIVSRSLKAGPTSVADLAQLANVEIEVAKAFMSELRAYDLVIKAGPGGPGAFTNSTKVFIRRASQYVKGGT